MTSKKFTLGRDHGSPRHAAVCAWLTENDVDINTVPLDANAVINGDVLTVDTYGEGHRLIHLTVPLVSEPSSLVLGEE